MDNHAIEEKLEEPKCPECGSDKFVRDYERAELICAKCGRVIDEDIMDAGPEWRAYDAEQKKKKERAGLPGKLSYSDKGLSTEISEYDLDIFGRHLSPAAKEDFRRLRRWDKMSKTRNDGRLATYFQKMREFSSKMQLPNKIEERSAYLIRKLYETDRTKVANIEKVVASILYLACRENSIPRPLQEFSKVTGYRCDEIGKTYRNVVKILRLKVPPSPPLQYVPSMAAKLRLPEAVQEDVIRLLREYQASGRCSGRDPVCVAGGSIYYILKKEEDELEKMLKEPTYDNQYKNEKFILQVRNKINRIKRTQKDISTACGMTEVSIRNVVKDLEEFEGDMYGTLKISENLTYPKLIVTEN